MAAKGTTTKDAGGTAAAREKAPRKGAKTGNEGSGKGVTVRRHFTSPGEDVFGGVEWELRTATIADEKGEVLFEQTDVEVPVAWSQLATNVVVSKYFHGAVGKPNRETSVRQLIGRVVDTMTEWGGQGGYFASDEDQAAFSDELTHLLLHQKLAFNSPVWFSWTWPRPRACSSSTARARGRTSQPCAVRPRPCTAVALPPVRSAS